MQERPSRRTRIETDADDAPKKGANPLLLLAVAIVVSVFFSLYWVNTVASGLLPKSAIDEITKSVNTAQANFTTSISSIPNTITNQINTVIGNLNTQVSGLLNTVNDLKSQISGQNAKIDNATNGVASLNSRSDTLAQSDKDLNAKVTALQTQLATAEARIKTLEDKQVAGGSSSTSPITFKLTKQSDSLVPVAVTSGNVTSLNASVKLVLTNPTDKDIDDIIVTLFVGTESIPNVSSVTITSSPALSWISSGWMSFSDMEFRNSWGLSVLANKSKTIYLTITVQGNTSANYARSYGYGIEAELSD